MLTYRQAAARPMLSREREIELVAAWKDRGDEAARDELITAHVRLCYAAAMHYSRNEEHVRDLAQSAVFALMDALDKFDLSLGFRFATYANLFVRRAVYNALSDVLIVVDMPKRVFGQARKAVADFSEPGWEARVAARGELSLDASLAVDGDGASALDLISCPRPGPEDATAEGERVASMRDIVRDALALGMNEREAQVLRRRMLGDRPETLEAISLDLGVTRERVRQIEGRALDKLRRFLAARGFDASSIRV